MDKLKEVDWRGLYKTATQKVKKYTLNLTDLEIKVEEATNSETWGPHGSVMNEIADAAYDPEQYRQVMGVLARRLQERDENWRMCYKALLLLEHLLKHGPGKVVGDVQSSASVLDRLTHFEYKDANMRDHGVNVRHRAKEILALVNSPERLREEREKARANRAKYRGVSGEQMRGQSFGRSGSDLYSSTTSGSLFPAGSSGGGGGGGGDRYGGFGSGGGGLGGASRRTDSYDETAEGAHYISKRGGGGDAAAAAPSEEQALAATQARIERLKLAAEERPMAAAAESAESKKRLTDVRVNPKIAASLGLKLPAAAPPKPTAPEGGAPAAAAPPSAVDLLGGLEDPAPAPTQPAAAPAAAPAPSFDPFAAAAPVSAQHGGWDAFSGSGAAPAATPPAAAAPLDMLGALDFGAAAATAPAAPPQTADPFAAFASQPAAPARPAAPAAPLPTVAAGVPAALPEDMFSDLTGIGGRGQQPMGQGQYGGTAAAPGSALGGMGSAGSLGSGWGLPAASPPSPAGGFGSFSGAAAPAATAPNGGAGLPGPGMGAPMGGPQHARQASHGRNASVDFGSLSYSSGQQQGGSSAADPFADLLG